MSKAKVGTGELKPFKKGSTGSESIGGSTNPEHVREGMFHNVMITKATKNVTELTPFKMGSSGPGINTQAEKTQPHGGNPGVPTFRERDSNGIDTEGYKPFSDKKF